MTRHRGNAARYRPDLRKRASGRYRRYRAPALTCAVTGNGSGPEMTEADDPMGVLPGTREEHRYQLCKDEDCERFPLPGLQGGLPQRPATDRRATARATAGLRRRLLGGLRRLARRTAGSERP